MILKPGESVLKGWISECNMSGRMQSIIISALRGADADDSPEVKRLVRWIRKQCVKEVNPKSHFSRDVEFIDIKALIAQDSWMWDRLKLHFRLHIKQALAVIGYYHPDEMAAARALKAYTDLQENEDIMPESKADLISRRTDSAPIARGEWVVNDWVLQLSGRMQAALLCSLRGSDGAAEDEIRKVTRWMRWVVMKNVSPETHYMANNEFMPIAELHEERPWAWGILPMHFVHHLSEALEIVGYLHPSEQIRNRALEAYIDLCKKSKGKPEAKEVLITRLQDYPGRAVEIVAQPLSLPQGN